MDFELTEEQKMFQAMVRDFCAAEIAPHAAEWDETEKFPYDVIKKIAAAGLHGVHFPEEYGGSGDELTFAIATEEISRACAGIAVVYLVSLGLGMYPVVMHGSELERKMGLHPASVAELIFDDCKIPVANMLGEEGKGFRVALEGIDASRVSIAAQALGIAQAAYDAAVTYSKERKQFGGELARLQAIQWMIADMATEIDAARLLIYRAAWLTRKEGHAPAKEAAMAKLFASEAAHRVCHKAVQIFGGYGYTKDFAVERYYRDQRITEIYEGTSEMQRWTIARQVLGVK
jgi:alkylation response protein AidB-like acyl-CoA dehydrogenase